MDRGQIVRIKGEKAWIRVRGAPSDPESFDMATWTGIYWEIPRVNSLGETIYIHIPDYMIIETMPASTDPKKLYRDLADEPDRKNR